MKCRINESVLFPSEFDYSKELEIYKQIGIEKYRIKDSMNYCKDYAQWCEHIRAVYNSINTADSRNQLKWAFKRDNNHQRLIKEVWTTIGVSIVMFVIGFAVSSFAHGIGTEYTVALLLSVVAELGLVIPIGRVGVKSEFDEDVILAIESESIIAN